MTRLKISPDLTLPVDAVTETTAVLGIRGSGKTNTATVLAEELISAGQQVLVVDPTDVWWGMKSSGDGKRAGLPVVVLGGKHEDLPLAAGDGAAIADFVCDNPVSVICSLWRFESKGDQRRFVTDLARRLYYRKGQVEAPRPLMVLIDEASLFVPQRVMGDDAKMVGAIQQLVRQGRSSGFGVTLIDQRAASVNKDVLTQLEVLICHRTVSPQDRKALDEWIRQHDTEGRREAFLADLASLPRGTAYVWSPGWLDVFARVRIRQRSTYDSSRTPKAGERVTAPRDAAAVDLDALKTQLGASIERARAEDPKALQQRIRELERQLAAANAAHTDEADFARQIDAARAAAAQMEWERHDRVTRALAGGVEQAIGALQGILTTVEEQGIRSPRDMAAARKRDPANVDPIAEVLAATKPIKRIAPRAVPVSAAGVRAAAANGRISGPQQRMLDALASFDALGVRRVAREHVAVYSGQSSQSSGFEKNIGRLRTEGYITYPEPGVVEMTDAGRAQADYAAAPATLADLHAAWMAKVSGPQARMLEQLIKAHPRAMDRDVLAQRTNQSPTSSGWEKNRGRLRALGLVDYPDSTTIIATDLLFPEGIA